MKFKIIVLFLFIGFILGAEESGGYKLLIKDVVVENAKEINSDFLIKGLNLKKGGEFSSEKMIKDYIILKELKYLDDVKIFPLIENGKILVKIEVYEKKNIKELLLSEKITPKSEEKKIDKSLIIQSVELTGLIEAPKDEIEALVNIKVGDYFSKEKLIELKNNLLKSGYFKDVQPDILKKKNGIYVRYYLTENQKVNEIVFIGNSLITTSELKAIMKTEPYVIFNQKVLIKDYERIREAYSKQGYVMADIHGVQFNRINNNLEITISEGILRSIEFKALDKREKDKIIKGKLKTKQYVLKRENELKVDSPFTLSDYQRTLKNLHRLSFFKDIKPEFKRDPKDINGVSLILNFDEDKTGSLNGGISYGSEIGLVGSLGISENNFLGRSQKFGLTLERSSKNEERYEISFSDPWIRGTKRLSLGAAIYYKKIQSDTQNTYENKKGVKLSIGKGILKNVRVGISTRLENIEIGNIGRKKSEKTEDFVVVEEKNEEGNVIIEEKIEKLTYLEDNGETLMKSDEYNIATLAPYISYDTRNNYLNATSGFYAKNSLTLGKEFGENSYLINELDTRWYHKLLLENNTFAVRSIIGAATTSAPLSEQFDVGGMYSLRGYSASDFEGKREVVLNLENRYKLNDTLQLVLFLDYGKAWDDTDEMIRLSGLRSSYGFGVRLNTPLGPMRFDFGWPHDDKDETDRKFHFGIGQLF